MCTYLYVKYGERLEMCFDLVYGSLQLDRAQIRGFKRCALILDQHQQLVAPPMLFLLVPLPFMLVLPLYSPSRSHYDDYLVQNQTRR